jgi:hypothetical protein
LASNKREVCDERRVCKEDRISEYFFIENDGKTICLICRRTVSIMREYNIKCYYESENGGTFCLNGKLKKKKISIIKHL